MQCSNWPTGLFLVMIGFSWQEFDSTVEPLADQLITLGLMFLLGLAADLLGRRTPLPRVTLLVLCGLVFGEAGVGWIDAQNQATFDMVGTMALVMVGFLLGGKLKPQNLRRHGREVVQLSLGVVLMTVLCMVLALGLAGFPWPLVLVLAGIATSTDPIATIDVIEQSSIDREFAQTLHAVVAIDDAWGLIAFSLLASIAVGLDGGQGIGPLLAMGLWEVVGAILLGIVLGVPMGFLSGRVQRGEPTLVEALGIIFIAGGVAMAIGVSYLLTSMVLGMVVAMVAGHHRRAFHEIEHVEWPIMVLFFIMAGASLDLADLSTVGMLGLYYIVLRIVGRWLGGLIGLWGVERDAILRGWVGLALLPQAGIALGTALLAAQYLPAYRDTILAVVVAATIVFELIGPPLTALALHRIARRR
jgi:Kef-type K+ transport system membrane component KefB